MSLNVCIIGTGAWGSAIACVLADNGHNVHMFGICDEEITDINSNGYNSKYFGKTRKMNDSIKAFQMDVADYSIYDVIVLAIPSFAIDETINKIIPFINEGKIIVNLSKGFEERTEKTIGQYVRSLVPFNYRNNVVSLLGPTFAEEVYNKEITAVTASGFDYLVLKKVCAVFTNNYFKVYENTDPIGIEYCAALKNIIAFACGIIDGIGLKINTRAFLITFGLDEISKFVTLFGGNIQNCYGLAGIGDLLLTCSGTSSRNYYAGLVVGKSSYEEFQKTNKKTVEGIYALKIAHKIAMKNNIDCPIINALYNVIFENKDVNDEIKRIMEV